MSASRQRVGKLGEQIARRQLEATGYKIVDANYRAKGGEIDLVAEESGTLVFVEVRTRGESGYGLPEESLTSRKRSHMVDAAHEYLQAEDAEGRDWRIDFVAVDLGRDGRVRRVEVLRNAVEL